MTIKVEATQQGFYGRLRERGDVFTVAHEGHVGRWMKVLKETPVGQTREQIRDELDALGVEYDGRKSTEALQALLDNSK